MCWDNFRWAKEVCLDPSKNAKKRLEYGDMAKRLVVLSLLPGVIGTLAASLVVFGLLPASAEPVFDGLSSEAAYAIPFVVLPMYVAAAALLPFLGAALVQFFGKSVFKWLRKDFASTYNAVAYASVPSLLFAWIPFVGQFAAGWSAIIGMYSLASQHGVSNGRALAALAATLIMVALVVAAAAAAAFVLFGDLTEAA